LNSGPPFEPHHQSFFELGVFDIGSHFCFWPSPPPGWPWTLILLTSGEIRCKDYRCKLLMSGLQPLFFISNLQYQLRFSWQQLYPEWSFA
jgi:hypothetical protein